jgi:hypothetical protein
MPVGEGISKLKFLWFHKNRILADLDDFDEASRGPWGSLWFMMQPKTQQVHRVTIHRSEVTCISAT